MGRGGQPRDTAKTAELSGIPARTIRYYAARDGWAERWLAEADPEAATMAAIARAEIRGNLPAVVRRLVVIAAGTRPVRDETGRVVGEAFAASDKDAIQAGKLLLQYGLGEGIARGVEPLLDVPSRLALPHDAGAGPSSAFAQASAILAAKIAGTNTRKARGPRV